MASLGSCQECLSEGIQPPACNACKSVKTEVGATNFGCHGDVTKDQICVYVSGSMMQERDNTTRVAISLLRRGNGTPEYSPAAPDYTSSRPEHHHEPAYKGASKGPGDQYEAPAPISYGSQTEKHFTSKLYVAHGTTASGYASSKPTHAVGKPAGGPTHGFRKPASPSVTSVAEYIKPSQASGKPSHGPKFPAHDLPVYGPGQSSHGPHEHGHKRPTPVSLTYSKFYGKPTSTHDKPSYGSASPAHGHTVHEHGHKRPAPVVPGTFTSYDKPTPIHANPSYGPESPAHGPSAHAQGETEKGVAETPAVSKRPSPFPTKYPEVGTQSPKLKASTHGPEKPAYGPPATAPAYGSPTPVGVRPSHGPGKPTAYLHKPSEKEYPGHPGHESPTSMKPTGSKHSAAKPNGGKPTGGIPSSVRPASKDSVSKKPIPYIEFDESECIDCHQGDTCYTECDWLFTCGQKKKCFHNGARDIVEICYEKGQKCAEGENGGYEEPVRQVKSYGKPARVSGSGDEKKGGHE
ncbi:hypothetical protein J1614_008179 [Plenodomus biglobosus]|nr:hypothetical protein J1614_008179 [Plenodomus biglobosus]